MKSSWINRLGLLSLLSIPCLAQEPAEEPTTLEKVKAKAAELEQAYELGQDLERAIKLLRALQPGAVHEHLKNSGLPEPLRHLLKGWAFHQQGDYERARQLFQQIDGDALIEDPYLANRFEELMKTADELKDFAVHETENFSIRYAEGPDKVMMLFLPDILEEIYAKYSRLFHFVREEKIIVELMPDHRLFSYASALNRRQIETTGTIALCVENRLVVLTPRRVAQGFYWPDVIAHEFVHYILTKQSEDQVPLWMQEGVAKYFEARWERDDVNPMEPGLETSLALAIEKGELLSVEDMMPSFAALPTAALARQAYAQTTSMIAFLCERKGEDIIHQIVGGLREEKDLDKALKTFTGQDFATFESEWRAWIAQQGYRVHENTPEMSVSLLDQDQPEEKIKELEEQDQKNKKHVRLGDLLLERNRYQAALKEYLKTPKDGERWSRQILLRLLECHRHLDGYSEMIALIDGNAVNLENDTTMLVHKARANVGLERHADALALLRRALRINPFNPEIYKLILTMENAVENETERAAYSQALEWLMNPAPAVSKDRKS